MQHKPRAIPRRPGRKSVDEAAAQALEMKLEAREGSAVPMSSERSDVRTFSDEPAEPNQISRTAEAGADDDKRIVRRKGRMRSDGSHDGARTLRRLTVYLPPELARDLDILAAQRGRDRSSLITEAVNLLLAR